MDVVPTRDRAIELDAAVRDLHRRGITGRHVGIAIVDQFLLTTHREFAGRLRWYDEIDAAPGDLARYHRTAVASIAVGGSVGVASEADLYFVGVGLIWRGEPLGDLFRAAHTGMPVAMAVRRILAVNARLAPDRRIRVIS
jgi:hypothetical protein